MFNFPIQFNILYLFIGSAFGLLISGFFLTTISDKRPILTIASSILFSVLLLTIIGSHETYVQEQKEIEYLNYINTFNYTCDNKPVINDKILSVIWGTQNKGYIPPTIKYKYQDKEYTIQCNLITSSSR